MRRDLGNYILDGTSPKFHGWTMKGPNPFCDRLRDVAMTTNFIRKISVFGLCIPSLVMLAFRRGLEYRNADGQLCSALNWRISFTNLVKFGSVTPEFRLLISVPMWINCQKLTYPADISECTVYRSSPIFTARRLAKRGICRHRVSVCVCVCVCLSHSGIVSKRLNIGSRKQRRMIAPWL